MSKPTDDRIAKLPVWARDHMRSLNTEIDRLTSALDRSAPLALGEATTVMYSVGGHTYPLPDNARILFQLDQRGDWAINHDVEVIRYGTHIGARTIASEMVVRPKASNSIEVTYEGDE